MIQIILKFISMFCGLGGQFVMPFITPIIGPFCWSSLVICFFLPIYFSKDNPLNSEKREDGSYQRSLKRTWGFSFLIYYVTCVAFLCSLYGAACKTSAQYNPY